MTTTTENARDALVKRLFDATIATLELYGVYLGERLGLYRALAEAQGLTTEELAVTAGIHPRYAREWLEQQAVAGLLTVSDDGEGGPRFSLPGPHREVLAEPENRAYVAPFSLLVTGIARVLPEVVDAYRRGGGVPWEAYGADAREGQAAINRPIFQHDLAGWIAAMPEVHTRLLKSDPPARVADVGCGVGWSTIAIAAAYPGVRVDGFDLDPAALEHGRRHAAEAGVDDDRVTFRLQDASGPQLGGQYDLVCVFEALHDMSRPVEALAAARAMLVPGGCVLVVDERVAERFTAPGDAVERMMYGWSITCCLPTAMVDQPSAATGTVMRADLLRRYASDAGFSAVDVLAVDHEVFRFYRLRP